MRIIDNILTIFNDNMIKCTIFYLFLFCEYSWNMPYYNYPPQAYYNPKGTINEPENSVPNGLRT